TDTSGDELERRQLPGRESGQLHGEASACRRGRSLALCREHPIDPAREALSLGGCPGETRTKLRSVAWPGSGTTAGREGLFPSRSGGTRRSSPAEEFGRSPVGRALTALFQGMG